MNKNKIQPGQCYEKNDIIYEVIFNAFSDYRGRRMTINRLTGEFTEFTSEELLKMRRPFQNYG